MASGEIFLLYPRNRPFLDGKERWPWSVRTTHWGYLVLACAAIVAPVGVAFWFQREERLQEHLKAVGVPAVAVVLRNDTDMLDTDWDQYGRITYRFTARAKGKDRVITRTQNVNTDTEIRYGVGAAMKVLYDSDNPDVVRIVDEMHFVNPNHRDTNRTVLIVVCCVGGLISIMSFALWLGPYWSPAVGRKYRAARVLSGEVTECVRNRYSDDFAVVVRYRFLTPEGKPLNGESKCVDRPDLESQPLPAAGTPIRVFYLDEKRYGIL